MHALVLMAVGPNPASEETQAAHERFIDELDRTNTVVLGGGWRQPAGGFEAAYLIKCGSLAEARQIAATDPFMQAGAYRCEVVEWELVGVNPDAVDRSSLLYP